MKRNAGKLLLELHSDSVKFFSLLDKGLLWRARKLVPKQKNKEEPSKDAAPAGAKAKSKSSKEGDAAEEKSPKEEKRKDAEVRVFFKDILRFLNY